MTAPRLDVPRLRALCGAATEGPWADEYGYNNGGCPTHFLYVPGHSQGAKVEMMAQDSAFIIAAREALPIALDEVERLRGLLADIAESDILCCICKPASGCECGHHDLCIRITKELARRQGGGGR
jgi:hypothetical protein